MLHRSTFSFTLRITAPSWYPSLEFLTGLLKWFPSFWMSSSGCKHFQWELWASNTGLWILVDILRMIVYSMNVTHKHIEIGLRSLAENIEEAQVTKGIWIQICPRILEFCCCCSFALVWFGFLLLLVSKFWSIWSRHCIFDVSCPSVWLILV